MYNVCRVCWADGARAPSPQFGRARFPRRRHCSSLSRPPPLLAIVLLLLLLPRHNGFLVCRLTFGHYSLKRGQECHICFLLCMTPLMEKSIFSMVEDEVLSLSSLSLGSFLDPQLSCRPKRGKSERRRRRRRRDKRDQHNSTWVRAARRRSVKVQRVVKYIVTL